MSSLDETGRREVWEAAVEALASRLYFLWNKFAPDDDPEWERLEDSDREIFRAMIRGVFDDTNSARTVLEQRV